MSDTNLAPAAGTTGAITAAPAADAALPDEARARVPLPVLLLLVFVIMVPIEFSFTLGPLFLTASKAFLVVITFIVVPKAMQLKLQPYDWCFIGHAFWSATAFMLIYGLDGLERSGFYVLEFLIVYLVARVYLRSLAQLRAVVGLLFVLVVISAFAAVPEGLSGRRYIHEFGRALTGFRYTFDNEYRMGIMRSASFFEHPILFGVFCSSALSLVWFTSTPSQRAWKVPLIFLGTFFAASSAPLLAFMVQLWLIVIERVTRTIRNRVTIFSSIVAVLWIILDTTTGRGMVGTIALVTLNPGTTYIRRTQWRFGIDDVLKHPFFGIEPSTWSRPGWLAPSIDNYWLLMMIRSGIPSLLLLFVGILLIWRSLAKRGSDAPELFVQMRKGWGFMMIALLLTGATVAFFGKLQPLLSFYCGFGAALAACVLPQGGIAPVAPVAAETGRTAPRYTRFGMGQVQGGVVRADPPGAQAARQGSSEGGRASSVSAPLSRFQPLADGLAPEHRL